MEQCQQGDKKTVKEITVAKKKKKERQQKKGKNEKERQRKNISTFSYKGLR